MKRAIAMLCRDCDEIYSEVYQGMLCPMCQGKYSDSIRNWIKPLYSFKETRDAKRNLPIQKGRKKSLLSVDSAGNIDSIRHFSHEQLTKKVSPSIPPRISSSNTEAPSSTPTRSSSDTGGKSVEPKGSIIERGNRFDAGFAKFFRMVNGLFERRPKVSGKEHNCRDNHLKALPTNKSEPENSVGKI